MVHVQDNRVGDEENLSTQYVYTLGGLSSYLFRNMNNMYYV